MNVIASMYYSVFLELALSNLEEEGISREDILAVPFEKSNNQRKIFDTMYYSDGTSLLDKGLAMAVMVAVPAASYGFIATWGPIIWGILGAIAGFLIGFLIDLGIWGKRKKKRNSKEPIPGVFIIVQCKNTPQAEMVKQIFWTHHALSVGKVCVTNE